MSKLFKRIAALLLAVALLVPGLLTSALAANDFAPPAGTGSITVTRFAGTEYTVTDPGGQTVPVEPGHVVAGVPVRIQRVTFAAGVIPTTTQLEDPAWMSTNATFAGSAVYGITGANGEVTFPGLAQGIWLVRELGTLTVTTDTINRGDRAIDSTVTNPIDSEHHFADFIVGIPRWIPELEWDEDEEEYVEVGGDWEFDVRVYPKSQLPDYGGGGKEAVYFADDVATWELYHPIPNAVGSLPYFSATDTLPSTLSFITGSVEGRFTDSDDDPTDDWYEVTGRLTSAHFDIVTTGQRIDIVVNAAGRTHLANNGLLGTGTVMFRFNTGINGLGTISNNAVWRLGVPPSECDPAVEDCIDDDFTTFNLEVLKRNIAEQPLAGAVFHMYRELTDVEEALTGAEFTALGASEITVDGNTFYVVPLRTATGARIEGTTGTDGTTRFGNANMSSYSGPALWLRELTPPTGYRIIQEWMPVTVNTATQRVVDGDNTYVTHVTVYNEPDGGWNLPQTGGMGTIILTIVGLVLVGGALVLFVGGKKDEDVA